MLLLYAKVDTHTWDGWDPSWLCTNDLALCPTTSFYCIFKYKLRNLHVYSIGANSLKCVQYLPHLTYMYMYMNTTLDVNITDLCGFPTASLSTQYHHLVVKDQLQYLSLLVPWWQLLTKLLHTHTCTLHVHTHTCTCTLYIHAGYIVSSSIEVQCMYMCTCISVFLFIMWLHWTGRHWPSFSGIWYCSVSFLPGPSSFAD